MRWKMTHLALAFTLAFLILAALLVLLGTTPHPPRALASRGALATVRYVAPGCSGAPSPCYTSIQAAVDAAATGDEVRVAAGSYTDLNVRSGVTQVVYLSDTLALRGGYSADFSSRDPELYVTTVDPQGGGRGFYVTGATAPLVEGFRITGGDATGLGGGFSWGVDTGGGVYVVTATAVISDNTITANVASAEFWGEGHGGGIYLKSSDARVLGNRITSNVAASGSDSSGWGGGLYVEGGSPFIRGNRVADNLASQGGWFPDGTGGGLALVEAQPTVEANVILGNRALASGDFGSGGGVALFGCTAFTLTNNVVAGNSASYSGAGIDLNHTSGVPSRGHFRHTTVADNDGGVHGAAGVRVQGSSVVTFTNTILADHETGLYVSFGCTATLQATLWRNVTDVGDDNGTVLSGTLNYRGDPAFLDAAKGDYHIAQTSAAKDRGVDAGVAVDADGTSRDANPDLGAYEAGSLALLVVKRASTDVVLPGEVLEYTVAVTNGGTLQLTGGALSDDLPDLLRPLAASPGCTVVDGGYGGRVECVLGTLGGGDARGITITAETTSTPSDQPRVARNTVEVTTDQTTGSARADVTVQATGNCAARVNGVAPDYALVQDAIDAASPGDEVWIAGNCLGAQERAGLDQLAYVDKDLTLRGGYSADFGTWDPAVHATTLDARREGRVVVVPPGRSARLVSLRITGGSADGQGGMVGTFDDLGGGVAVLTATAWLSDVEVVDNVASLYGFGFGGGVGALTSTLTLVRVSLTANTASSATLAPGQGGGLFAAYSDVRLDGGLFAENAASGPFFGTGGGASLVESDLVADASIWRRNTVARTMRLGVGGGVALEGTRPFTLTNCVLVDNQATDGLGGGGSGLWVSGPSGALLHPTLARNLGGEGVSLSYSSTVTLTNALVVSHGVGIRAELGCTATVTGVLWHQNVSNTVGSVVVSGAITGTPGFAADGYHIEEGSLPRDRGVASGVPYDVDGEPRPYGPAYDLGADEYVVPPNLPPLAHAGEDQEVAPGALVALDGSASSDPDGHVPLDFRWAQSGGQGVGLSDPGAVSPTFTAPGAGRALTFTLVVTDSLGLACTEPDEVRVEVVDDTLYVYLPLIVR